MKYNNYSIITTFLAALFGAGFVACKEIEYFLLYDPSIAILSVLLYFAILFSFAYFTMKLSYQNDIDSFDKLVSQDNKIIQTLSNLTFPIFAICLLTISFSGFATLIENTFSIPKIIGTALITIIVITVSFFGSKKMSGLFKYSTPIIVVITLFLLVYAIFKDVEVSKTVMEIKYVHPTNNQFINVAIYALECYQISLLLQISLGRKANSLKDIKQGVFITCALYSIALMLACAALLKYATIIGDVQIPLLEIINYQNISVLSITLVIVLFVGFITSSLSTMFGYVNYVGNSRLKEHTKIITVITCIIALVFSQFSFSSLISTIFPVVGIVGLINFILIIINSKKLKKAQETL
ncbi:putative membrane protein YkvI [Bacilli bacterium PM5-9]|nr:putative membrane protein YkvI [Bacilli bacterium PM5-9]